MYLKIKRRELINIPSPAKTMLEVRCGSEGGSQLGTEVWPQVCGNEVAGCGGAGKWEKCGMQGAARMPLQDLCVRCGWEWRDADDGVQGAGCGWRCGVWVGMQAGMWGAGGLTESHLQGRAPGGGCRPGAGVRELRGACRGPFSVRDRAGQPRHGPLPTSGLPPATRPAFRSRAWPRYRPPRRLSPEERPGCSFAWASGSRRPRGPGWAAGPAVHT